MAVTINADDGAVSGSAGLKQAADATGVLALQTNGTTAVSISTGQVVTLAQALPVASGGTGATTSAAAPFALKGANSDITSLSGLTTALSVGQGGTGLTTATGVLVGSGSSVSAVAAGTNGNVLTSNGTTWVSQAAAAGGTAPVYTVVTTPGTWTKPATVKAIQVTVVGGGGNGGSATLGGGAGSTGGGGGGGGGTAIRLYPAPSLPGPQPYTVGAAGSTSSFGVAPVTVISATGGSAGGATSNPNAGGVFATASGGAGGAGSNGNANIGGSGGGAAFGHTTQPGTSGFGNAGSGGASSLGGGGAGTGSTASNISTTGANGQNYGGGAAGGLRASNGGPVNPGTSPGGTGASGVIIIEEFY